MASDRVHPPKELQPPAAPQSTDADGFAFDFAEYIDVRVEGSKQGVSGGQAAKRAKIIDEQYAAIKERIEKLEKNLNKRIDRLQGTVMFMSKCVEDFNENFGSIMDLVKEQRVREVANNITEELVFPLSSTVDVQAYIESDPQMVKLIDRYVQPANPLLYNP